MSRPNPAETSAVATEMKTPHRRACGPNGGPIPRHRICRNMQAKTSDTTNVPIPPTTQPSMSPAPRLYICAYAGHGRHPRIIPSGHRGSINIFSRCRVNLALFFTYSAREGLADIGQLLYLFD